MTSVGNFWKRGDVGYRVDYGKFLVRCEWDRLQQFKADWDYVMHEVGLRANWSGGQKLRALGADSEGERMYAFEVWGHLAEAVHLLSWEQWSPYCERIDLRTEVDMCDDGRQQFYEHVKRNGARGRNVVEYSSKKRSKEGGRHAGGKGVAVGSHASDYRLSVYQRGDEPGALEFQLRGARIERGLNTAQMMLDTDGPKSAWRVWQEAFRVMWANAWVEGQQITMIDRAGLLAILAGDALAPVTPEEQMRQAARAISQLSLEQRMGLFQQLQLGLFAGE